MDNIKYIDIDNNFFLNLNYSFSKSINPNK